MLMVIIMLIITIKTTTIMLKHNNDRENFNFCQIQHLIDKDINIVADMLMLTPEGCFYGSVNNEFIKVGGFTFSNSFEYMQLSYLKCQVRDAHPEGACYRQGMHF